MFLIGLALGSQLRGSYLAFVLDYVLFSIAWYRPARKNRQVHRQTEWERVKKDGRKMFTEF